MVRRVRQVKADECNKEVREMVWLLQTVIASVDEITLRFISDDGTKIVCSANIQVR